MKAPLLLSLAAVVLSALALAATFLSPRGTESRDVAPAEPVAARAEAELLARVQALSDRLDLLALMASRERAVPTRPLERSVPAEEFEVLRDEVRELLTGQGAPSLQAALESEVFQERVAETLTRIRREERLEAVRTTLEEQPTALEETLPKYEEWLGLSGYQSGQMRLALEGKFERDAELLQLWAGGAADDAVSKQKAEDSQAFQDAIGIFLTPEQLATYMSGW
jgi:hypothetical protein